MRYAADQKRQTHERIVAEAARLFRAEGYRGTGVDAVMAAAGLTAGGFYAHFKDKDALLAEAVEHGFTSGSEHLNRSAPADGGREPLAAWVDAYLSDRHRSAPDRGCPIPALAGEVPRQAKGVRAAFAAAVRRRLDALAGRVPAGTPAQRTDAAIRVLAAAAGGLLLARAVADDPELSDRILTVVRASLRAEAAATPRLGRPRTVKQKP